MATVATAPRRIARRRRQNLVGWAFITPAVLLFAAAIAIPSVMALGLSFTNFNIFSPTRFVGLDNYLRAFQDTYFLLSLRNIAVFVLLFVPSVVIISFLLAALLNARIRGIRVFRVLFFLPALTSPVASAVVWKWLMSPSEGLLNQSLGLVGVPPSNWLNDSRTAMISIVIICVWSSVAMNTVIYLAALQGVPTSVYESARMDGAGWFRQLWQITLPLVAPTTFFVLTIALIGAFQIFDQVFVLTQGGPAHSTTVPLFLIYQNAFKELQMGYASAQAMVLFVFILAVTVVQQKLNKESLI